MTLMATGTNTAIAASKAYNLVIEMTRVPYRLGGDLRGLSEHRVGDGRAQQRRESETVKSGGAGHGSLAPRSVTASMRRR